MASRWDIAFTLILTVSLLLFFASATSYTPQLNPYTTHVRTTNHIPTPYNEETKMTITALHVSGNQFKDEGNNTIVLQGNTKFSMEDNADGYWYGSTVWSDEGVKAELQAMRNIGGNFVRGIFAINAWIDDTTDAYSAISTPTALARLAEFTAERNMYLAVCPWTVITGVTNGGAAVQDPLPYPPYALSVGAGSYIAEEADFVDFWSDVADALKSYDNVLFELYNEPRFGESTAAKNAWYTVAQNCITAIRATGAENVILVPTNACVR